mmetsp:Transcript_5804/g.13971  ORF Transcript_5804/g.13971 Transcript_5804/m.13971 type:complete len:230 (+) Transcript_5804:775-1464(+)
MVVKPLGVARIARIGTNYPRRPVHLNGAGHVSLWFVAGEDELQRGSFEKFPCADCHVRSFAKSATRVDTIRFFGRQKVRWHALGCKAVVDNGWILFAARYHAHSILNQIRIIGSRIRRPIAISSPICPYGFLRFLLVSLVKYFFYVICALLFHLQSMLLPRLDVLDTKFVDHPQPILDFVNSQVRGSRKNVIFVVIVVCFVDPGHAEGQIVPDAGFVVFGFRHGIFGQG